MVLPLLRPTTIAAATGLVAGGAFTSYTTVYADGYSQRYEEQDYDRSYSHNRQHDHMRYDDNDDDHDDHDDHENDERYQRHSLPELDQRMHRFSNQHSLVANEEDLLPGLLYVALAGVTGSLVARQRNILVRMFSPLAFAAAAGAYFLPDTTHAIVDS
ncbi:hypothetical protein BGZ70_003141, partial [Mortierella alpina]